MKGFEKKGVSPVIATILLIALTVAAIGIVAVILTTLGTPAPPPSLTFGVPQVYVGAAKDNENDNSTVIDLPLTSGSVDMKDLRVYLTCSVDNYLGKGGSATVTYTAQLGDDGQKMVASVSPPAPAQGVPASDLTGVYVQYYGTPIRKAGDKISFFFQSDNTNVGTDRLLPTAVDSNVIVKLIHIPSSTTVYEDTITTRAKTW